MKPLWLMLVFVKGMEVMLVARVAVVKYRHVGQHSYYIEMSLKNYHSLGKSLKMKRNGCPLKTSWISESRG